MRFGDSCDFILQCICCMSYQYSAPGYKASCGWLSIFFWNQVSVCVNLSLETLVPCYLDGENSNFKHVECFFSEYTYGYTLKKFHIYRNVLDEMPARLWPGKVEIEYPICVIIIILSGACDNRWNWQGVSLSTIHSCTSPSVIYKHPDVG